MAKVTYRDASENDPIYKEGFTISSHNQRLNNPEPPFEASHGLQLIETLTSGEIIVCERLERWIQDALWEYDLAEASFNLTGEALVFSLEDTLEVLAENIIYESEKTHLIDFSDESILSFVRPRLNPKQLQSEVGLHAFPVKLEGVYFYVMALIEFWQGGASISNMGLFENIEQAELELKNKHGLLRISQFPNVSDDEILNFVKQKIYS